MPTYVYEAKDPSAGCAHCARGFEAVHGISEPKVEACPECGAAVYRVIQAPALGSSQTDLHYRAKRAGFKCMKKLGRGEYETMY